MTGMKVVSFFLLISLMIFSTHALDAFLSDGIGNFSYVTKIHTRSELVSRKIVKHYVSRDKRNTFDAQPEIRMVIVYIKAKKEMERHQLGITRLEQRQALAAKLVHHSCNLLYLSIGGFHTTEVRAVGDFLRDVIKRNPDVGEEEFRIVTHGWNNFTDVNYGSPPELNKFDPGDILGIDLLEELAQMDQKI